MRKTSLFFFFFIFFFIFFLSQYIACQACEVYVDGQCNDGHVIQDEAVTLQQQPIIDFQGAGVTAANSEGKTVVTISTSGLAAADIDTSAELATILTDENGTGYVVFSTSPNLTTPTILATSDVVALKIKRGTDTTPASDILQIRNNADNTTLFSVDSAGGISTGGASSQIVFYGSTSGTITLQPPAVSGTNVITFPALTGTIALTSQLVGADEVYASGWNADTGIPEKDDVYDYLHLIDTNDDGDVDNIDATLWATKQAAVTASRSLTLTGATLDADAELYTDTKCINIDPTATTTDWFMWRSPVAVTITGVDCIVDAATSVVLTPQECDANGANCVDIEAAITCVATNTTEATSVDNASIDAGDYIRVTRGTKTGSPTQAMICLEMTFND